ncbi:MAG: uroporphyrinogen-III synthase [Pseudomonadota bacterium]
MNPSKLTLLLTRPAPASARFAAEVEGQLGAFAEVIASPILEIVPLVPFPGVPDGATLAFTSENAVRVAAPFLSAPGRVVWCVGPRTAEAAREAGLVPKDAQGDAADLAALLATDAPRGDIVHLSGLHQAGDLVARLRRAGLAARRVAIYDQIARPLSEAALAAFDGGRPIILPLFSPRSARLLAGALPGRPRAPVAPVFFSQAVAAAWGPKPPPGVTAEDPNADAMITAIAHAIDTFSDA